MATRTPVRRFEFVSGNSNKYWQTWTVEDPAAPPNARFVVRALHGAIGTSGTSNVWEFTTRWQAESDQERRINDKLRKGYKEIKNGKPEPTPVPAKAAPRVTKAQQKNAADGLQEIMAKLRAGASK